MSQEGVRICPDCGANPGERHTSTSCDVQRCTVCRGQYMVCQCGEHNWDEARWTGHWPGSLEAAEKGWFVIWTKYGWISCAADEPGARPDLNRYSGFDTCGSDPGPHGLTQVAQEAYFAAKITIMVDEHQVKILDSDVWLGICVDLELPFDNDQKVRYSRREMAERILEMREQCTGIFDPMVEISDFKEG